MIDLLFIVIMVAFFALMVAFVHLCERIVGKDEAVGADVTTDVTDADADHSATTTTEEVPA